MYRYYTTRKTDNGIPDCPAIPVPKDIHLYGDKGQSFPFIGTVWSYAEYEEPLATDVVYDYGLKPGPIPQYFPINEQTAKTAKDMMSFSDYKYGSATASYRLEVDKASVMAHYHKQKIDPMYHEKVDGLLNYYAQRLAANINQENSIGTRCPSILVAGGSNFPVRKKQKQVAAYEKNSKDYQEVQNILSKITSVGMGGISSDDSNAVEKLRKKLDSLTKSQETMKAVNAYYRKNKTLDGCDLLPLEQIEQLKADMKSTWNIHDKPFPPYALSNNNANIRRVKARIEELEKKAAEATPEGFEFDGGRVEYSKEDNRIRIFHDEKPDPDTIRELKSNGFKWSPRNGCWQRQDTDNARHAMKRLSFLKAHA